MSKSGETANNERLKDVFITMSILFIFNIETRKVFIETNSTSKEKNHKIEKIF